MPKMNNAFQLISIDDTGESLATWSDGRVKGNTLFLSEDHSAEIDQVSMYESWAEPRQRHFRIEVTREEDRSGLKSTNDADCLLIFDTWGTSSYYHLLIDHIIPLWITREFISASESELKSGAKFSYYRISKNGYDRELSTANEIFKHFMGDYFSESIDGCFGRVVYGYLYRHRPHHGPNYPDVMYDSYRSNLNLFREKFCTKKGAAGKHILVPERQDRVQGFVRYFVNKYKDVFDFRHADFARMSIEQQIETCGASAGLFGSEGAAFANQVFLPRGSVCVPVCKEHDRFDFHKNLSIYCGHKFIEVSPNFFNRPMIERTLLRQLREHVYG